MSQKLLKVLRLTILTSAISHLIILAYFAAKDQDLTYINAFNILDLDLIWPELSYGVTNFVLSYLLIFAIGLFWYLRLPKQS